MKLMENAVFLIMLAVAATAASDQPPRVLVSGTLLEADPNGTPQPIWEFKLARGTAEFHMREDGPDGFAGTEHYRGSPLNFLVEMDDVGTITTNVWVDDENYWLEPTDELSLQSRFDATQLIPQRLTAHRYEDGTELIVTLVPSLQPPALGPTPLTAESMGLLAFCLQYSPVIVDDTFKLGELSGFGERVYVGIPGLADVNFGLAARDSWTPIGRFEKGVIEITLGDGHSLAIFGVGTGPDGSRLPGPFTVFGEILPPTADRQTVHEQTVEGLRGAFEGDRLDALMSAVERNPFVALGRSTIAFDRLPSDQLTRHAGNFGEKLNRCWR